MDSIHLIKNYEVTDELIIAILKLDTNTHGWFLYYSIFRNYILIVKSLLLLLIITSTFYFNIYNVKLVKTNIV